MLLTSQHESQFCIPTSSPIVLSSSPNKEYASLWISKLNPYERDKEILESSAWINDNIIYATQCLLQEQTKGDVLGGRVPNVLTTTHLNAYP